MFCPLGALMAQSPDASPPHRAAATATLPLGATVRVAKAGARVTGRIQASSPDSLVLAPTDGAAVRIALADVDTVWRATPATKRGAVTGAVVGGFALATFGMLAVSALCESDGGCGKDVVQIGVAGGALGAAGGALLGAGIGSLAHTWRRVYHNGLRGAVR
jgi:hypothetical protein